MKRIFIPLFLLAAVLCGCSEHTNDSKYRSDCPRFGAMTFSADPVEAGGPVTITCVESRAGKLLDRTTYEWTFEPAAGVTATPSVPKDGIYDGVNPAVTVTFPSPGTYSVTFRGTYHGSGQVNYFEDNAKLEDGTTARYSANTSTGGSSNRDYLHATLTRRVVVK